MELPPGRQKTLKEIIDDHVRRVLDTSGGNRAKAARVLGIARSTLYKWLDSDQQCLRIDRKEKLK